MQLQNILTTACQLVTLMPNNSEMKKKVRRQREEAGKEERERREGKERSQRRRQRGRKEVNFLFNHQKLPTTCTNIKYRLLTQTLTLITKTIKC